MSATRIMIDTDCGVDDAIAIMLALSSPVELDVLGITAVSGNVPLGNVVDNVLRLLTFVGRTDIPVFRGASMPLVEPARYAKDVHGGNGLGGVELPPAQTAEQHESAPDAMARIARENPGLTLLTLGPLTNVAIAINLHPELVRGLGGILAMGGAIETGNVTRFAEFNFFADPEAVQCVLDSGIPLTLLPWDATLGVAHTEEDLVSLGYATSASGRLALDMQQIMFGFLERVRGVRASALPDPLAAACLIDPSIARRTLHTGLRMELGQSTLRGACITQRGSVVTVLLDIDKSGFDRLLRRVVGLKK